MAPTSQKSTTRQHSAKGHAVVEVALIAPWIFFLFIATLDFGFYIYWLMAVTNASRTAALHASINGVSQATACNEVLNEMRGVLGWEAANAAATCNAPPLTVTVTPLDSTTTPLSADASSSVVVSVQWETVPMIWVPGIDNQFTIRRDSEMRRQ